MAKFIMHERDIPDIFEVGIPFSTRTTAVSHGSITIPFPATPQVSSLLSSPEMKERKAAGILIGDLEVVELVLQVCLQLLVRI